MPGRVDRIARRKGGGGMGESVRDNYGTHKPGGKAEGDGTRIEFHGDSNNVQGRGRVKSREGETCKEDVKKGLGYIPYYKPGSLGCKNALQAKSRHGARVGIG